VKKNSPANPFAPRFAWANERVPTINKSNNFIFFYGKKMDGNLGLMQQLIAEFGTPTFLIMTDLTTTAHWISLLHTKIN
jgi:hypothetical protein